jgi:hypothetical protein
MRLSSCRRSTSRFGVCPAPADRSASPICQLQRHEAGHRDGEIKLPEYLRQIRCGKDRKDHPPTFLLHKPTEVLSPLSNRFNKAPIETWRHYAPLFRQYSTASISPELLAALAQVESAANPVASTYWRWRLIWEPFAVYQPASSAVGMYQMTDAAFAEAQGYCILHHTVVEEDSSSTALYSRILLPKDAPAPRKPSRPRPSPTGFTTTAARPRRQPAETHEWFPAGRRHLRRRPGSLLTRCWRKPDSNPRSPVRDTGVS